MPFFLPQQTAGNKKTEELRSLLNHLKTLLASAQESLAAAQSERMEINEKKVKCYKYRHEPVYTCTLWAPGIVNA